MPRSVVRRPRGGGGRRRAGRGGILRRRPEFLRSGVLHGGINGFQGESDAVDGRGWCCVFFDFSPRPLHRSPGRVRGLCRDMTTHRVERIRIFPPLGMKKSKEMWSFFVRLAHPTAPAHPRSGRDRGSRSRRWRGLATPTAIGFARYSAGWDPAVRTSSSSDRGWGSSGPTSPPGGPASS